MAASMTSTPVARCRSTSARSTIEGAGRSAGEVDSVAIGSPPSSGRPSASTTRPRSASPTGTRTTSPVPRTRRPAATAAASPRRTQPMVSCPRSTACAATPPSISSNSSRRVSGSPSMVATPSPACTTRPMRTSCGPSGAWLIRLRLSAAQSRRSSAIRFMPAGPPPAMPQSHSRC